MNNAAHSNAGRRDAAGGQEQDQPSLSADQRMKLAVARIDASRSALIVCLSPTPPASRTATGAPGDAKTEKSFADMLAARIARNGLVQGTWRSARALARRWWTRQPWHSSVELVGQTLLHEARPLIRRNPLATLAVGAALGAGLVAMASAVRPRAWLHIQKQSSPWRDRMGSFLWSQLTAAPVQMALAGAIAAWLADQGKRGATGSTHGEETPDIV